MNDAVPTIAAQGLVIAFIPAMIAIAIMYRWNAGAHTAIYASLRMLVQLLLIGYVLIYIFESDDPIVITAVLLAMLAVASSIAIRPLVPRTVRAYLQALVAISVGSGLTIALVTQAVVGVEPWFAPRYVVPLAGMIFSGSMNGVSLAAERFQVEMQRQTPYPDARRSALQTAMIPMINSLFAVGVVALPGMMTGQVLSGVSPLIAAKYQIVVMTMLLGSSGISAAIYLALQNTGKTGANRS